MQASRGVPGGPGCSSPGKKILSDVPLLFGNGCQFPQIRAVFFETRGALRSKDGEGEDEDEQGAKCRSLENPASGPEYRRANSPYCLLMRLAAWDPKRRGGISNEQPASDLLPGGKVGQAKKKT